LEPSYARLLSARHRSLPSEASRTAHLGHPTWPRTYDSRGRSKAAQIAGKSSIRGEVIGTREMVEVPLDMLFSPKEAIETAGAGLDRWLKTLRLAFGKSQPPPILIQPGNRGTPLGQVRID
jgi:hypothetical protein